MPDTITVLPVGWRSKEPVQIVLISDTTLQQLKDRVRAALGPLSNDKVRTASVLLQHGPLKSLCRSVARLLMLT